MGIKIKITNSNYQYNYLDFDGFSSIKEIDKIRIWKNDFIVFQVVIFGQIGETVNLRVENPISFESRVYKTQRNLAFKGEAVAPIDLNGEKIEVSDLLIEDGRMLLDQQTNSFFISLKTNTNSVNEKLQLIFESSGEIQTKELNIEIIDKEIDENFDIELWQYPYSVSEYYGVEAFSTEHIDILKNHLRSYVEIGGDTVTATICEDAWNGQTFSKNEIKYPSMIKWIKKGDNFTFDYSDFDKWIQICQEIGLLKEKIVLYGMAPWHNSFTYYENGNLVKEKFDFESERYSNIWKLFLENLYCHMNDLRLIEKTFIGIDEQGFNQHLFEVINEFNNSKDNKFKISAAIDNYEANSKYAKLIDYVSVSMIEYFKHPENYLTFRENRIKNGQTTTLYSCVGHKPGNFSLSAPMETTYTLVVASRSDGFLRWALDAWVENPVKDTTHVSFEPGDCFLVYPDDNRSTFNPSIRYLKMIEGIAIAKKIKMIEKEDSTLIKELFENFNTKIVYGREYLNKEQLEILEKDISKLFNLINY